MGIEGESRRLSVAGAERAASAPDDRPGVPLGEMALRRIGENYDRLRARNRAETAEDETV